MEYENSRKGLELIKSFEGCKLNAYKDQAGIWTIGWGHTKGVKPYDKITEAQADKYLQEDLKEAENAVNAFVKVATNPICLMRWYRSHSIRA